MDITSEDIVFLPSPGMDTPASLKFSPTGNYLAYLKATDIGSSTIILFILLKDFKQ